MPRYKFKAKDLEPLRSLLNNPDNRRLLESTLPNKRVRTRRPAIEETVELPVAIQSRDKPDGVPLHSLLRAVQAEMPSVVGISVRGDAVVLKHKPGSKAGKPSAPDRRKLAALLGDRGRLETLRRDKPTPPAGAGPSLVEVLLDDATPDGEWLKAFRRYAVAHLIKR